MSMHLVVTCDANRNGQPCRGALNTREVDQFAAERESVRRGWRFERVPGFGLGDVCPSRNHDGIKDRS